MNKKIVCTECGAKIYFEKGREKDRCNFCGSFLDFSNATDATPTEDVKAVAGNAISFKNSLVAEVNGQKASIVDMWDSLTSNSKIRKEQLLNFYKGLTTKIRFCIEAYKNTSDDVKYELGDFICTQMESIIEFRLKNKINFIEELDEIDTMIKKQEYDCKARGLFQIKAILIIRKRIARLKARRTVLYYDYALQATEEIIAAYNSKIEPLKSEFNATAMTAFERRKALKEKIESLELAKKREIDEYGMKEATKEYNRVVKKFKIEHTPMIEEEVKKYVPGVKKTENEVAKVDYNAMSINELIDALNASVNALSHGITRSETENCKSIKAALEARANEFDAEAGMYFNAMIMSVNMIFSNENPTVMAAMISNISGNFSMQSNNLKRAIAKKG